jgi:hypothetical protein
MFRKKPGSNSDNAERQDGASHPAPKFLRPKILLIDVAEEAKTALDDAGYSIQVGSFGKLYRVEKSDSLQPVIANGSLPADFSEQEVVIIDLDAPTILDQVEGEKHISPGENDWWAKCSTGVIDPRPRSMAWARNRFDRILSHGGVFVVLSAPRHRQEIKWGCIVDPVGFYQESEITYDNWSFLSVLDMLTVEADSGCEIQWLKGQHSLQTCLAKHHGDAHFVCRFNARTNRLKKSWVTLAESKYRDPVAGVIMPESESGGGWVIVLPRFRDPGPLLIQLLGEVLPNLAPQLFPHSEGARWVQRPAYELPQIKGYREQIGRIKEKTHKKIATLEGAIDKEREELGHLHDILTETGRPLVLAVKRTLELLGFRSVVDADEVEHVGADSGPKREDLQILDESPTVLVEVKGISGLPSDEDALQVWKYLAPRMRQWSRTDIRGLSIINHQRNLPALDRENRSVFRDDLITNAQEQHFGLLTTWDLFRIVRSFLSNSWRPEHVQPLFYQDGRITPVPTHYEFVGMIANFWPEAGAVGVRIEGATLEVGDYVAYELPTEFVEQRVESLQVDGHPVESVSTGSPAGIATDLTQEQARQGVRVFRVSTTGEHDDLS